MIADYVKGFLVLFLLIKVLLYFVPKNSFAKYISFFSGVVLVIGILHPLLTLFGQEQKFLRSLEYQNWEKELLELAEEAKQIQEEGKLQLEEKYKQMAEADTQVGESDE